MLIRSVSIMIERLILLFGITFGIVSFQSLFKRALVKFKKVKYPIRFLPNIFRSIQKKLEDGYTPSS